MKNSWSFLLSTAAMLCFSACDDDAGHTIQLPESIQAYLDANYSGAEIEESEQDTLCTGTVVYEVKLEVKDNEEADLTFSTEGALLFTENEIPANQLPTTVTAAISANYAGFSTEEAERLDLAVGGNQYEVELKNGAVVKSVLFNADGTVVCEELEDEDDEE
ncbi:MAG: PepSY-like domain-containing protein [Bacteroidetes bacterium]|nr:PepSY-like domain-containing protein [Bacteroidota bacterium]